MLGKPIEEIDSIDRGKGKTGNFSILYGQGIQAMADALGVTYEEAAAIRETYFEALPNIKLYVKKKTEFAQKNGYSVTKYGRKMRIWEYEDARDPKRDSKYRKYMQGKADRMAVNTCIQGSATGDIPKIAMVRSVRAIKKAGLSDKVHLVMNVHDALEFYVHKSIPVQTCSEVPNDQSRNRLASCISRQASERFLNLLVVGDIGDI